MVTYMFYLAAAYPHLAHVIPIGSSTEGRPLYVLKVSTREVRDDRDEPPQPRNASSRASSRPSRRGRARHRKPAIWIDAGESRVRIPARQISLS